MSILQGNIQNNRSITSARRVLASNWILYVRMVYGTHRNGIKNTKARKNMHKAGETCGKKLNQPRKLRLTSTENIRLKSMIFVQMF